MMGGIFLRGLDRLIPVTEDAALGIVVGVVIADDPVMVRRLNESDEQAFQVMTWWTKRPTVGKRVWMIRTGTQYIIAGMHDGPPDPAPAVVHRFKGRITASKAMASGTNDLTGWSEVYNVGGGFVASTGVFTAPVAGLYTFTLAVNCGTDSARRFCQLYSLGAIQVRSEGPATGYSALAVTFDYEMDANQTIKPQYYGSAATDIRGDFAPSVFCGRRVL